MRALIQHEGALRAYVDGTATFEKIEALLRDDVRLYAVRRAKRWRGGSSLVDDLEQAMVVALWRALDAYDAAGNDHGIASWCGSKIEYTMRRFFRAHSRVADVHVYDDEWIANLRRPDEGFAFVEVVTSLRGVDDDGVRAYALAALDASNDVVARIAADVELVSRLGWSDVAMGCRAARKRAARNTVLRETVGG